jgi:DNA repair ATPase RecN
MAIRRNLKGIILVAKTINGLQFELSQPYAEGHTITPIEARVLNQCRAENIGNNTRAKIKEMQDANASEQEIQDYVASVDQNYEFTAAGVSASRKLDPVEREANKIARDLLRSHLASTGRKLTVAPEGMTDEEWDDKVSSEVERIAGMDEVLAAAKKAVAAKQKQADTLATALEGVSV